MYEPIQYTYYTCYVYYSNILYSGIYLLRSLMVNKKKIDIIDNFDK